VSQVIVIGNTLNSCVRDSVLDMRERFSDVSVIVDVASCSARRENERARCVPVTRHSLSHVNLIGINNVRPRIIFYKTYYAIDLIN
jgi:nicotinamidase-related amidase